MAGLGTKLWTSGEVVTAAGVNGYLQDQTIGKFASTSARDAAFGGAGEPTLSEGMFAYTTDTDTLWFYTGSAWEVATIKPSVVDAKGDLLVGTAADTLARQGVGANGSVLMADSAQTNGIAWSTAQTSDRNKIINGMFNIWQRGTSVSVAASQNNSYTADRWALSTSANSASVVSRQATGDTTNLPFIQYCARVQRNSGQTGTSGIYFDQSLETPNSIPFIGRTVAVSFYARKGANYSATSSQLVVQLLGGTGTDQNVGTATGVTVLVSSGATLTGTWQRFTATATVATTYTQLFFRTVFTPTGTAGANDYFEITGVQFEEGSVATPFETEGFSTTLAKCQRYYYIRIGGVQAPSVTGVANFTTNLYTNAVFPVTMRANPTIVLYSYSGTANKVAGFASAGDVGGTVVAATVQIGGNGFINIEDGSAPFTIGTVYWFYFTANAEL